MNGKNFTLWFIMCTVALCLSGGEAYAQKTFFANYARYAEENAELVKLAKDGNRVVFLGNSITENWVKFHPDFFSSNGYVGRGISGQTTYQLLLRFREDVINLSPAIVVINGGGNDVAENTNPYCEDYTFGNIVSMAELAVANNIKVILTSVLPAAAFGWNKDITDAPQKIKSLNKRIEAYAQAHGIPFVNYFLELVSSDGDAMNPAYTEDGVHPTIDGYYVMEAMISAAIKEAL